ncbi:MAG: TolC family protein [Cyclobacteriaceae bacterium]
MRLILILIPMVFHAAIFAQDNTFSVGEAIDYGLKNNEGIQVAAYEVESQSQLKKTSFDLPKTDVSLVYGQYNSYSTNDNNITVTQKIPFSSLGSQGRLNRSLLSRAKLRKESAENELAYRIKEIFYQLAHAYSLQDLLRRQDSLFEGFYQAASIRYKAGETRLLEQTTAEVHLNEAHNRLRENESDISVLKTRLKGLLNTPAIPDIDDKRLREIPFDITPDSTILAANPSLTYVRQQIELAANVKKLEAVKAAPDLLLGFFSQTLTGTTNPETGTSATRSDRFAGIHVGVSIPLWFRPQQGRIRSAEYEMRAAESNYRSQQLMVASELEQAVQSFQKNKNSLEYYKTSALVNAELILEQSQAAFRGGEIGYTEYLVALRNAIDIREGYLQTLNAYNQSVIYIEFLAGNK